MRTLGRLFSYVAVAGGLSALMVYGAIWLVRPDPTLRAQAHVAPIPARIADSIARRKDDLATEAAAEAARKANAAALAAPAAQSVTATPVMNEANVSLTAVEHAPLRKPARVRAKHDLTAKQALVPMKVEDVAAQETPRPVTRRVSTARTDFPY